MSHTHAPSIKTMANLESAFAGESMAHIKYRYFAKICREWGDLETAEVFEATANQEVMHAFGHLDLLYPKSTLTPPKVLQMAIDGETYEYTEMYPTFKNVAIEEGRLWPPKKWTTKLLSPKNMLQRLPKHLKRPKNAFLHWPKLKKNMPSITKHNSKA